MDLTSGAATRHLRIRFGQTGTKPALHLPGSADGRYGAFTSLMRLPLSESFFVFVTSASDGDLTGESQLITSDSNRECDHFDVYLLNCLTPTKNTSWAFGDWLVSAVRTPCAYDLTRISLPTNEINLTRKLTITRKDQKAFPWSELASDLEKLLLYLSFLNCSGICSPVIYGYEGGEVRFLRFEVPRTRSVSTNRRSWATELSQSEMATALACFLKTARDDFWASILRRAIDWQTLAHIALHDSPEQALSTVQMLLELLSYVLLVEDAAILSEAGYGKLPASDRITLLCAQSNQEVLIHTATVKELGTFCAANSISNIGELITALRNKLIHPTKKNREYLDQVPTGVRQIAIDLGLRVASLAILKTIDYRGMYYDIVERKTKIVPWAH